MTPDGIRWFELPVHCWSDDAAAAGLQTRARTTRRELLVAARAPVRGPGLLRDLARPGHRRWRPHQGRAVLPLRLEARTRVGPRRRGARLVGGHRRPHRGARPRPLRALL